MIHALRSRLPKDIHTSKCQVQGHFKVRTKQDVFTKHYTPSSSLTLSAKFHLKSGHDLQGQGHMGLKLVSTESPCQKEGM